MTLVVTLPDAEIVGTRINCNCESTFTAQVSAAIQAAVVLLASPRKDVPPVDNSLLTDWVPAEEAPPANSPEIPPVTELSVPVPTIVPEKGSKKPYIMQFRDSIKAIRSLVKDPDGRATVYKIIFAAALSSQRNLAELTEAVAGVREIFDLGDLVYAVVSDGTAKAIPDSVYKTKGIKESDKQLIMALNLIALNADDEKHVLEIGSCKLTMMSLEISALDNKVIGQLTKKDPKAIFQAISPNAQPAALLSCMRMVLADGLVREAERRLLRSFSGGLTPESKKTVYRIATLERGKKFDL